MHNTAKRPSPAPLNANMMRTRDTQKIVPGKGGDGLLRRTVLHLSQQTERAGFTIMRMTTIVAVALFTTSGLVAAEGAQATITRYQLNIPRQPLDTALKDLAQQTGLQVGRFSDAVRGDTLVGPIAGNYSADQALKSLLAPTRLTYRTLNDRAIIVLRPEDISQLPSAHTLSSSGGSENSSSPRDGQGQGSQGGEDSSQTNDHKSYGSRLRLAQENQGLGQSTGSVGPQEEEASQKTPLILQEVVVTAQKRSERLIDVPLSVSVLSSSELANLGATQLRDFANTVPGLSFTSTGAGQSTLSLRGVTTGVPIGATVGVYVDDVPYGSSGPFAYGAQLALDVGLFDLDRIEVLRGPQGTLYGSSTMGGLLKYVSKQPNAADLSVGVQSGVSNTDGGGLNYNGAIVANVPVVTDKAAVRASVFYSRDGGYVDNATLDQRNVNRSAVYGGRLDVLLKPLDDLTIRLDGYLQDIFRDGTAAVDYTLAGRPVGGELTQFRPLAEPFEQQFRLVSATVNYNVGFAALTSITSYQTTKTLLFHDLSGSYVPLLELYGFGTYQGVGLPENLSTDKFTQEARFVSSTSGPIQWLIGGYFTHESSQNNQVFDLLDATGQPALNNLFTYSTPTTYEEYAGFADLTYRLTKQFDVSGGIRYARDKQEYTQFGSGYLVGSEPTRSAAENVVTYLANGRYHFDNHSTGYVRFATGYRPGGPNFVAIDPATHLSEGPPTYKADNLKSYEMGFKTETPDQVWGVEVAAYYIRWSDIQIATSRGGFSVIVNAAGGATIRGAELNVTARPVQDFSLKGAFAYQNAHLSGADEDLGATRGERLPDVPRVSAALNADYTIPLDTLRPSVGATLRYVSERWSSFDNSQLYPQYRLPPYGVVDLRSGLALDVAHGHPVNLQLFVHNVLDKRGQLSAFGYYSAPGTTAVTILQPRTVGISASTQF
jgi:iron complex outermembrane recepter protein